MLFQICLIHFLRVFTNTHDLNRDIILRNYTSYYYTDNRINHIRTKRMMEKCVH